MEKIYRINPSCPYCGEEHMYWNTYLTTEEQAKLDLHTEKHRNESSFQSLLSEPGIVITRKLKCGVCKKIFEAKIRIWKENEVNWHHPDFIEIGKHSIKHHT